MVHELYSLIIIQKNYNNLQILHVTFRKLFFFFKKLSKIEMVSQTFFFI